MRFSTEPRPGGPSKRIPAARRTRTPSSYTSASQVRTSRMHVRLLARQADEAERRVVEIHRHLVPLVDGDLVGRVGGDVGLRDGLGHVARDLREPRRPGPDSERPGARVDNLAGNQTLGADHHHHAVHGSEVARRHLLVSDTVLGAEDRQLERSLPPERLHRSVRLIRLHGADDHVVALEGDRADRGHRRHPERVGAVDAAER